MHTCMHCVYSKLYNCTTKKYTQSATESKCDYMQLTNKFRFKATGAASKDFLTRIYFIRNFKT
ncbi:Orf120 [Heliothis zea nudivirus]|uniref:Orf120 n=1 Tax=Heliothis zea nudivirus 1 TaxID=3116536 RepID=Q8JKJ3_9VIRU|nr:Orf120 [Heliothis zea nudivirus]AAN04413.1 Orf120 [Heliothis zea nudivirus]